MPSASLPWPAVNETLDMPEAAAYGWAKRKALELGCPPASTYCALLVLHGGHVNFEQSNPKPRPTLYVCLLGPVHLGKSIAMERAVVTLFGEAALSGAEPAVNYSEPASAESISEIYPRYADKKQQHPNPLTASTLVFDELVTLMKATQYRGSKLPAVLNTLYYRDFHSGMAAKAKRHAWVRLSILGALPVESQEDFRELWRAETSTGLHDRFIFVPGPKSWKLDHNLEVCFDPRAPQNVTILESAYAIYQRWVDEDIGVRGRLGEIGLRVALISASLNGETTITEECMTCAIAFAAWQLEVRKTYGASRARSDDARFTEAVLQILGEHRDQDGHPEWVLWPHLYRKHHWSRNGSLVRRVKEALIADRLIEVREERDAAGHMRRTSYVRIIDD